VYNIKDGRNANIVKYCATLREYGIFTDMIRENRKTMPLEEAIRKAVADSIDRNVLKTFLLKHKQEIETMLLTDWDWNVALDVSKEEGFEMGWDKGMEKGEVVAAEKIARAMKEEGADINFIAKVTNLPIDTIQRL
jgi:predicted transposase YdaD